MLTQVTQVTQVKKGLGNTISKSRKWFFTLNNYTEEDIKLLTQFLPKYIFQEEKGEEGTPHLQGYAEWPNAVRFTTLKKEFKTVHWEQCRNKKASIAYCTKLETRNGKIYSKGIDRPEVIRVLDENKLYAWQEKLLKELKEKPDDRTISWYWDVAGNIGKTAFSKLLCHKYGAIVLSGKQTDMFHGIVSYKEKLNKAPKIIIIDIPRSMENYVSYGGIEKIKDGLFFSGKYEGGMFIMNSPHVICFANFDCPTFEMSADRWNVVKLGKKMTPLDPSE